MIEKKNIPLIIALAIPVLMIALVAAFIYLPGIGQKPKYNFLYATGINIYSLSSDINGSYNVESGHITYHQPQRQPNPIQPFYKSDVAEPHFYLYNVTKGTAEELTFDQAKTYSLDPANVSEDGYTVQRGNGGGDFIFGGGGSDYNNWYIKGHNRSTKLNLKSSSLDYYNFQFLGWIK